MKKQLAYSDNDESLSTHHPFRPQEVRTNDPVQATLTIDNKDYHFPVWKVSPVGIELVLIGPLEIDSSKKCLINIKIGQESSSLHGIFVHEYNFQNKVICCIRFVFQSASWDNSERRQKNRWNCSPQFFPTGIANSPAKYNDFIYFKIRDISFGGMKITCSLRNKFLFPKMNLNAMINFPMISQVNLKLKIINLNIGTEQGKDVISMGVSYDTSDPKIIEIISNYLLQFSNASSLKDLQSQGFRSGNVSAAIDFSYVKSKEDYSDCLQLRLLANKSAEKITSSLSTEDMADEYDVRSRIVIGRHQGTVVSTVRLAFHELDDKMEIEKYAVLPESFPRRDQTIEIMRLCTHPAYRGSDLLMALFKHLAIVVVQSRRKYIVASCVESLIPLYKKIGFKETGIRYESPLFSGFPDHVMMANVETLLLGNGINPIVWNLVWGDLYNYFEYYDMVEYTPIEKFRVKAMRALKPIANMFAKKVVRRS